MAKESYCGALRGHYSPINLRHKCYETAPAVVLVQAMHLNALMDLHLCFAEAAAAAITSPAASRRQVWSRAK